MSQIQSSKPGGRKDCFIIVFNAFSYLPVCSKVTGFIVFAGQIGMNFIPAMVGTFIEGEPETFKVFIASSSVFLTLFFATAYAIGKKIPNKG